MNFTRTRLTSLLNKLKFVFLLLLYAVGEVLDAYYPNMVHSIVKETIKINPFNMTNITGYVYFSITGAKYPTVYDEYLNITAYGAVIKRKVDYCQSQQNTSSFSFFRSSSSQGANKADWVSTKPIDTSSNVIVNETSYFNNVSIGNLTISPSFYTDDLVFYYLGLEKDGLNNFTYSQASSDFEYIKKGYFYHSTANESANSQLNEIQNELLKDEESHDDILYEAQVKFFEQCNSGDVRIRYKLYAPINVTYFGYVENYTLKPVVVDDIRFGATARGSNKSLRLLARAFTPNGLYSEQDSMEEMFTVSYLYVVKMKIAFDIWRLIFYIFRNDPIRSSYWLITVGLINFTFRSLIWSSWELGVKFWGTALIGVLIFGLIFGIWRIQFNQTMNQIVDVHIHFDRDAIANMQQIINNMGNAQIHVRINRAGLNNQIFNINPNVNINNQNQNVNNENLNNNIPNNQNQNINNQNINNNVPNNQNINNNQNTDNQNMNNNIPNNNIPNNNIPNNNIPNDHIQNNQNINNNIILNPPDAVD